MTSGSPAAAASRRPSQLRRNLFWCTTDGLLATPWGLMILPGIMFTAGLLTQVLGVREGIYGLIVSLPAWFNALQLIYIPLLTRFWNMKWLNLGVSTLNAIAFTALAVALPYVPVDNPSRAGQWMLLFFLILSSSHAAVIVLWTSWVQEFIPPRVRGKYFGRRNSYIAMVTVVFTLGFGLLTEFLGSNVRTYQIIFGIAALLRWISIVVQFPIVSTGRPNPSAGLGELRKQAQVLFAHRPYWLFVIFAAQLTFWFNFAGPFSPLYMNEYLGFPVERQALLLMTANIANALMMPVWGRLMDRHGIKPVIAFSALLWQGQNYFWVVLTPETNWFLYPMWFWGGGASGGVMMGLFTLLLKLVPREQRAAGVSFNLTMTSIAGALAPILTGGLVELAKAQGHTDLTWLYRTFFFIAPTAILLSLFILRKVDEPKAEGLRHVLGAFRTMRQAFVHTGLVYLSSITPVKRRRR